MNEQATVTDRLIDFIRNMSEADQKWLLSFLEKGNRRERRNCSRKQCETPVDWSSAELAHTDFLRDVSPCGAFLETQRPVRTGQEVTMIFSVPEVNMSLKVTGKVVRSDGSGMGVEFTSGHGDLGMFMKYF